MKRVIVLCVAAAVMITVIVTGSVAYFTDSVTSAGNLIRSGSLDIVQYEWERGTGTLVPFQQNKDLLPSVGTPAAEADEVESTVTISKEGQDDIIHHVEYASKYIGLQNYVDKIVCVENTGTLPTYVRTFVAVPTEYASASDKTGGVLWIHLDYDVSGEWTLQNESGQNNIIKNQQITVNDRTESYDVYVFTRTTPLDPDAISGPNLLGFYMDSKVSNENGNFVYIDGNKKTTLWPTSAEKIEILVETEAAQVTPFLTEGTTISVADAEPSPNPTVNPAYTALKTTFERNADGTGYITNYHPWISKTVTTPSATPSTNP